MAREELVFGSPDQSASRFQVRNPGSRIPINRICVHRVFQPLSEFDLPALITGFEPVPFDPANLLIRRRSDLADPLEPAPGLARLGDGPGDTDTNLCACQILVPGACAVRAGSCSRRAR